MYYGWPLYSEGTNMWGTYPNILGENTKLREHKKGDKSWDPNLRNIIQVSDYNIHSADGEIDHVEDYIVDDETWAIRYLIFDTKNW